MIHLRLAGGLGNQLFQLSTALFFSKCYRLNLVIHTRGLQKYSVKRNPTCLKLLKLPSGARIDPNELKHALIVKPLLLKLRLGKLSPIFTLNDYNYRYFIAKGSTQFFPPKFKTLLMDGYFQKGFNESVYQEILPYINSSFLALPSEARDYITKYDAVIHIRGTDFLGDPQYSLPFSYYLNAIKSSLSLNAHRFLIITDDTFYATSFVKKLSTYFPKLIFDVNSFGSTSEIMDFRLLANAKILIAGRSTFSWWASALHSCVLQLPHSEQVLFSPVGFRSGEIKSFTLRHETTISTS